MAETSPDVEVYPISLIRPWRGLMCDRHVERMAYRVVDTEDAFIPICQQCYKQRWSHLTLPNENES
jgi:hypothetical protein